MNRIEAKVQSALWSFLTFTMYQWRISTRQSHKTVFIDVICNEFSTPDKVREATNRIEKIEQEILQIAGVGFTQVSICVDRDRYFEREPFPGAFSKVSYTNDDGDDSPNNPNWPSKTGNPSGGGRGNNSPRR